MEQPARSNGPAAYLPRIVLFLCLLQPCMDVLSYWLDAAGISNTVTLLLRFGVLGATFLLGFALSDRRRYYYALAGILALFTLGHIWACVQCGYDAPVDDLANQLRIFTLPLTALAFITFLRREPKCLEAIRKGFFLCLLIILAVELLSVVTGTNPYTYPNKAVGILGWFYFANSQSAILSMLAPVAIVFVLDKYRCRPLPALAVCLAAMGMLYFFATRLAFAALLGTGLGLAVSLVIVSKTRKRPVRGAVAVVLACTVLAAALYPLSPLAENTRLVAQNLILKQEDIDTMVAADEAEAVARGLEGQELEEARLRSAYETYLPGPTGRFGLSRTAALYEYSTDANVIADIRLERLNFCSMLLEDSPKPALLFGMEREDMSHDGVTYDVENDFHGIFYLCGLAGLGLMLLFLAWFLWRIAAALIRDFRHYFTLEAAGYGIALICCLAHAYFTAGVLRRPNATFYLAVILAAIYGLTQRRDQPQEKLKEVDS